MKRALSLILALVLCFGLCACGGVKTTSKYNSKKTMEENLADGAKAFASSSVNAMDGFSTAGSAEIQSVTPIKENKWFVMLQVPISYKTNDGKKLTSACSYDVIATYDQENGIFTYEDSFADFFDENNLSGMDKRLYTAAVKFVTEEMQQSYSRIVEQEEMDFGVGVIEENIWHLSVRIEKEETGTIYYFHFIGTYDQQSKSFSFVIPANQRGLDGLNK